MAVETSAAFYEKTDEQKAITEMVRQFADEQILPNAEHFDHEDEFPEAIVAQMKELGLFGETIPEDDGGMGLLLRHCEIVVAELRREWKAVAPAGDLRFHDHNHSSRP